MKNNVKRVLSALLCFAMVLSYIPQISTAEDIYQWITIEAEDTQYAVWNRYSAVENNTSASGGKQAGGAPGGSFARYDDPDSTEDLLGGFLDKSNSPYVAFYVDAPADGTYKLSTAGSFWSTSSYITNGNDKYYAVFFVNGVAYKAKYPDTVTNKYQITEEVDAELKKGINTVYVIPITDDQDSSGNTNWANVDYLKVGGLQPVSPVKAQNQTVFAADAPYVHNYNRNADGVTGMLGGDNWDDTTIPIDTFKPADVDKYHGFTITVSAPADGYYDITATYKNAGNAANRAVGLMVDGVPQAREFEHLGADKSKGGKVDLSVYLTEGDHVLTITAPAKRTATDSSGNNVSWFNYYELILSAGLTKAAVQYTPNMTQKIIQANDTDYTYVNRFDNVNSSNTNATDGICVGSGHHGDNQSLAALQNYFDRENNTYVAFALEAPEDGDYQLILRYVLNMSGISNGTEFEAGQAYATFLVNGQVQTADFGGTAGNFDSWMSDTPVTVSLKKGLNYVIAMPLTAEQMAFGGSSTWADVDCLKIDSKLTPLMKTAPVEVYPKNGVTNLYNEITDTNAGGGDYNIPKNYFANLQDLSEDNLNVIPYVSYTVEAPRDGWYEIITQYGSNATTGELGYLLDGVPQVVKYSANPKCADLSAYLTAGTHTLVITCRLPENVQEAQSFNYSWTDLKKTTLGGGLQLAAVQQDPTANAMKILEAESDAIYNNFHKIEPEVFQGATVVGYANTTNNPTLAQLQEQLAAGWFDKSNTNYIAFQVEAPEDGEYAVKLRYKINDDTQDVYAAEPYAVFLVNGETLKTGKFTGLKNKLGYTEDVKLSLKKGINTIYCMSMLKDMESALVNGWTVMDHLAVDSRLAAVVPGKVELKANEAEYINLYEKGVSVLGNANNGWVDAENVCIQELNGENLYKVPFFSYTLEVPADGYYDMTLFFNGAGSSDTNAIGVVVDGVSEAARYAYIADVAAGNGEHKADVSAYLTKGAHTLVFTMQLPVDADAAVNYSYRWTNMVKLQLHGGVAKAAQQQDPITVRPADYTILEAESDAFYNNFYKIEPEEASFATVIGYANTTNNPTLEQLKAQLAAGWFDKSNTNYLGFQVEAPEDGEYEIKLRYKVNDDTAGAYAAKPYVAYVVNGETLYTADFAGVKNKLGYTDVIKVQLQKGINTIYCISLTKDLENALDTGWTQVDHLAVDSRLIKTAPAFAEWKANEAEFVNLYKRSQTILSDANANYVKKDGIYIQELSRMNLAKVPYFSYTVEVPADGYYDMTLFFNGSGASDTNAIGVVLDGVPRAARYAYMTGVETGSGEHKADVSAHLTKGVHTLVFTMQLPVDADAAVNYSYRWTNMVKLQLHGGIVLAQRQEKPAEDLNLDDSGVIAGMIKLEAESDAFFGNYKQDNTPQNVQGALVMGNAQTDRNPTFAQLETQLKQGNFDKSNISYVGYLVEAPEKGEYEIKLHYQVNDNTPGAAYPAQPYVAFVVNGEKLYTGEFAGRKNRLGDTEVVGVTLEKGVNAIYCIPLVKDLKDALDDGWTNVDYLAVSDKLKKADPTPVELEAAQAHYINLYKPSENANGLAYLGNAQSVLAANEKLYIEGLCRENIGKVPYFSYTVDAPNDGYYDMTLRFAGAGDSSTNAIGLLVDGKAYAMGYDYNHSVDPSWKSHDADLSVYLTKGQHTLTVTMQLPVSMEAANVYKYDWTDLVRLTVRGGISVSQTPVDPDAMLVGMTVAQAEEYCAPNYYEKVSESWKYSGGKAVTNGGGTRQTDAALQEHLDKKEQSYVEYMVTAPADGEYKLVLGLELGGFKDDFQPYVWLWINGQLHKVQAQSIKGLVQRLPVTVKLAKGNNVIRVIGATKDLSKKGVWIDHDFLAADDSLTFKKVPELVKVEAEDAVYFNHYVASERKSASGGGLMGSSAPSAAMAGVSTKNLSTDNVDAASYISYTVYAPEDGYYTVAGRVHMDKGERYGKLGLLVDDKAYVFGMHQNKWGDQNYAEAAVYLTKGNHVIVATGLLADTFSDPADVLWIDYDWVELGNGLQLASQQVKPAIASGFTRFEAEAYALGNMYQRNAVYEEMSGGFCNYGNRSVAVQSWEQVKSEGVDGARTPYVKYQIDAPAAGTYKVRLGMSYKHNGKTQQDYTSVAVVVNGEAKEIRLPQFTNNYCKPFPLTVELELDAGVNQVIFTGVLADITADDAYVNLHYDYLDVTGGLKALPVGQRLEAETSENNAYIVRAQKSASGGSILAEEDWNSVWTNDLTFDNLNIKTYMAMPWVRYNVVAEEDGVYEIGIGFNSDGDVPADVVFMAMSVNSGEFQKVYYTKMQKNCILTEVELKQGDNTILLTAATKDHLNMPNYPSQADGTNLWIDHDYLELSAGLSGMALDETPKWFGDAEADFRIDQDSVWGDFTGGDGQHEEAAEPTGSDAWVAGIVCAGAIGIIFFVIVLFKKKKKNTEEVK